MPDILQPAFWRAFFLHTPQIRFTMAKAKNILETEKAIEAVKQTFEQQLSKNLNLNKVSAPIAVLEHTGLNDELNGVERPVSFRIKALQNQRAVIVHSLAKWKRLRLKELEINRGQGILTDMKALRPDEDLSSIHSIFVDQWDWEKTISPADRNLTYLKATVVQIYEAIKTTEDSICLSEPDIRTLLPDQITFIHAEELLQRDPLLTPKDREKRICKEYGAVFIIGIGAPLSNGKPHDGRAPDYDDWSSENEEGFTGLNGDILCWHPLLKNAFELSSMGIRVDPGALDRQLELRACQEKAAYPFHQMLLRGALPESIGGGIGQSRMCMQLLQKAHIGEVQSGIWPENERERLCKQGICIL